MVGKRLFSLALSMSLIISMSSVALAAGNVGLSSTTGKYQSDDVPVTGTVRTPVISISLPTSNAILINPYGMEVSADAGLTVSGGVASISSPEYTITSNSEVDLVVSVSVAAATRGGTVSLTSSPVNPKSTGKYAFIYLDFKGKGDTGYSRITKKVNGVSVSTYAESGSVYNSSSSSQVRVYTSVMTKNEVATIAKNGGTLTYSFFGSVTTNPTKPWTEADTVSTKLTFTFKPVLG